VSNAAWRVVRAKYAAPPHDPFDGEGARLQGGRWNSPGVAVTYTSGALSLAVLETLVHADDPELLRDRVAIRFEFVDALVTTVGAADLPKDWTNPDAPPSLKAIGDAWVASGRSLLLRVPSAVIPVEFNYLCNPAHPDFKKLVIEPAAPLPIDPRLLKKR
jgi:RES domain-containing protein